VQWQPRSRAFCKGSARTRTTLADREAVRPPLWDLGTSTLNAPRTRWLGLRDAGSGVIRAIFDSPTAATSFANWIRATHARRAGPYEIGLFEREGRALRPFVPVDLSAVPTFRPLMSGDERGLRVGPLGEP
jgi:hypothetical protein